MSLKTIYKPTVPKSQTQKNSGTVTKFGFHIYKILSKTKPWSPKSLKDHLRRGRYDVFNLTTKTIFSGNMLADEQLSWTVLRSKT